MQRVLVSACLLGQPVRYDGGTVVTEGGILARWQMEGRIVPMCPEMAGGLPVPRLPAEIHGEGGGAAVLRGAARVVEHHGHDVTDAFLLGAQRALEAAQEAGVQVAVEFQDPDGHTLELYWGIDQIGTDGYVRPPEEWRGANTLEDAIANPPPGQTPVLHDRSLLDHA